MKRFLLILTCALGFFLLLQITPGIPGGDDGYRHATFARLLITNWQEVRQTGWHLLYLWPKPVDIWFLFHVLLAPLTLLFDRIMAVKIFSTLLFGLLIWAFLMLLDFFRVRYKLLWLAFLLLGSGDLLFRIALGRPFLLSLLLLLLATWLVLKSRGFWLAVVSAAHALAYSVFFLILVVPIARYLTCRNPRNLRLVVYSFLGMLVGLLLNPFFPENLGFSLVQIFTPLTVGLANHLQIGSELYPLFSYPGLERIAAQTFVFGFWMLAIGLYFKKNSKAAKTLDSNFILLLGGLFFLSTLWTQRTEDYFVFFALIFLAGVLTPYLVALPWASLRQKLFRDPATTGMLAIVLISVALVGAYTLSQTIRFIRLAPPPIKSPAALSNQTGQNTIVFNAQWDQYPRLYYADPSSYYIVGMDPTFMYLLDTEKYWLWRHLSDDQLLSCPRPDCFNNLKATQTPYAVIKKVFGSNYVFLENRRNPNLKNYLDHASGFQNFYHDEQTTWYKVL
jgi:hypothetical protein